ncbi:hypothetical protein CDAR_513641 [Caerostris darwini]|uniref:Uncharacterized protein n=1 Tax=Caerostris darwini TaxID=1538125 RepID=A0AAV4WTW3_9ARAC|nr:hypothetical protein CDAR_513641 [Caerostris darwini]
MKSQTQQSKDDGSISNPVSLGMNLISRSQSLTSLNDDTNHLQRANIIPFPLRSSSQKEIKFSSLGHCA